MFRRFPLALLAAITLAASLNAQTPAPSAAQGPAAPPPARAVPTQNVKVDVVITDTFGTAPVKKTVALLLLDGRSGRVRASQNIPILDAASGKTSYTQIGINIDATPYIRPDGRVEVQLTVGYTPNRSDVAPGGSAGQTPAEISESLSALLIDGKPTVLSQSADPQSDRKVTLEVTATVVR